MEGYAESEQTLRLHLSYAAETRGALVRVLENVGNESSDPAFGTALAVAESMLTNPSQKSPEAQAAELARLLVELRDCPELDVVSVPEILASVDALERVGAVLREHGCRVRVSIRGLLPLERPSLVCYIDEYVAAVRMALDLV